MQLKKLIVVLGMHRSGTSVITRALTTMGVDLGNSLMRPNPDNPMGFYEDNDLAILNENILKFLGKTWHSLSIITQDEINLLSTAGFLETAKKLLMEKLNDVPIFGFKDPRVSKLLRFWIEIFNTLDIDVYYLIMCRCPTSVANSLKVRDDFEFEKSYGLWGMHMLSALYFSSHNKRVFADYDKLLEKPYHEVNRIALKLSLTVDTEMLNLYVENFLTYQLRHHPRKIGDSCPGQIKFLYEILQDQIVNESEYNNKILLSFVQRWFKKLNKLNPWLNLIDQYSVKIHRMNTAQHKLENKINQLEKKIIDLTQHEHKCCTEYLLSEKYLDMVKSDYEELKNSSRILGEKYCQLMKSIEV